MIKLLESQKKMIKTATKVQLQNALKETINLKEKIEKELINRESYYHLKKGKESENNPYFENVDQLIDYVIWNGICPSKEIYRNGEKTGEYAQDFLVE